MAGDYSRKLFDRANRYSGVLMQQGRVLLDADWNEQLDIQLYRTETEAKDVIGVTGVPKKDDGFRIAIAPSGHDLTISAGRIYVDGLLCEIEAGATYTTQPFFPNPDFTAPASGSPPSGPQLTLNNGTYLAFLDAWIREVTARERAHRLIREVALGGPDTTTRLQTVFQIKLLPIGAGSPISPPGSPLTSPLTCKSDLPQFDEETALTTGKLNARTQPPPDGGNACLLPPTAGYTRLENQLYRVEIHKGGPLGDASFKWSRNNASFESTIEKIDGSIITVTEVRKDEVLSFRGLQWVEIVDDESSLKEEPHPLVQIEKINQGAREITVKMSVAALAGRPGLRLRGWDQSTPDAGSTGLAAAGPGAWIDLEDGVQVRFLPGQYHPGNYWLIPARTATGEIEWPPYEIPNTNPEPQPPRGVRHHYARLALVEVFGGVMSVTTDCRETFPSLVDICAEDICYDNDSCQLPGVGTVQDAIDRLCAERDLRFHKKHLHGWGIVCGLQVQCGPDPSGQRRRHVTVKKGYAIDCEGNDVILKQNDQLDIVALAAAGGLLKPTSPISPLSPPNDLADGDVCLVLNSASGASARYSLEPYPANRKGMQEVLRGTLLMDFFEHCIQSLTDFWRQEFTAAPGEEKEPVGPTAKRITTFSNLLVQIANPENGSFVFLSGERNSTPPDREDTILRQFYARLRDKLQSHTFCAMFENARPLPAYPYSDTGIRTIFSRDFKTRFRASPDGVTGYSFGAGNTINVFNLATDEMVAQVQFPAASSAIVQDVAFSSNGSELYAVATLDERDTLFAVADVNNLTVTFRSPIMICDVVFVTLATSRSTSENVYAIGRGKGLYEINPRNVNVTPQPIYPFVAVGHLVVHDQSSNAFATVSTGGTANTYEQVVRLNLKTVTNPTAPPAFAVAAREVTGATVFTSGEDDIALTSQAAPSLYIVSGLSATANANKQVAVYNGLDPNGSQTPGAFIDLGENTTIRLAHNATTNHMMVSYEDSYRVGLVTANHSLVGGYRHPVQVSPLWIDVAPDRGRVYVLNFASNTISAIPANRLRPEGQLPLQDLVDYRTGVINAFADLLAGLLQYLKDCFCDHVLVDCPTCDEDDKLYLACITIKNGEVFKICNFSLRKYVHSFPTWEYWLSVVPVLPFLRSALERMCCAALPALFGRYTAPRPKNEPAVVTSGVNRMASTQLRQGVIFARDTDFRGGFREQTTRARTGGQLFGRAALEQSTAQPQPRGLAHSDVVNLRVDDAKQRLETGKVTVEGVEVFQPTDGASHVGPFVGAPTRLPEGSRVVLVTDTSGKVLYYKRAQQPPAEIAGLRADLDKVRTDVADVAAARPEIGELKTQIEAQTVALTTTQASVNEALQLREEVKVLRAELALAQKATEDVKTLRSELTDVQKANAELAQIQKANQEALVAADREIAGLRTGSTEFTTRIGEMQKRLDTLGRPRSAPEARTGKKKQAPTEE